MARSRRSSKKSGLPSIAPKCWLPSESEPVAVMDDRELIRARWATFAALLIVSSSYLYFSFDQDFWVAGTIGLVTSLLLTAVLDFWLRLSLRRATGGERF